MGGSTSTCSSCSSVSPGALYLVVFVVVQGITGASPGEGRSWIRVVRPDGTPPGVLRSMVRAAAWAIDGIALVVPIALWSAWFTPGHRRVGAWAAGPS